MSSLPEGFVEDAAITGITRPIAFDWSPDGRLFVGQENGQLRVVKHGLLLPTPALTLAVDTHSERGLLGVALDPQFPARPYLYLYYTTATNQRNRVSRFTLAGDTADPASETVLVDGIPSDAGNHNAGDLHFGPDGLLYISTGDGGVARNGHSQNLDSLGGKILRVDPTTGLGVADNPFYSPTAGAARQRVWAYGLRNPFRFAFQPDTETMYIADVGNASYEELDRGRKGANYGWPQVEGPSPAGLAGLDYPLFFYDRSDVAPFAGCRSIIGGAFVPATSTFPGAYHGDYLFADYVCGRLFRLQPGTNPAVSLFVDLQQTDKYAAPVHLAFGPDGVLHVADYNLNRIRRIRYTTGNRPPTAQASASPTTGSAPLTVSFSSSGSGDPDGEAVTYRWDFGDGSTSSEANPRHTYTTGGTYQAVLTVTDRQGASTRAAPLTIQAGNTAPAVRITAPADGTRFRAGTAITLEGSATDAEDGALGGGSLRWEVLRHHGTSHTHPWAEGTGTWLQTTMPPPEDLATACTSKLEVRLTATDALRASATDIIYFYPICSSTYLPSVHR